MKIILHKPNKKASVHIKGSIIYKVNDSFLDLTGYSKPEIIGKTTKELTILLKLDSQLCLERIEGLDTYYLFTKEDKPEEVNIYSEYRRGTEEKVYYFEKVQNTSLDDILKNNFAFDIYPKRSVVLHTIDSHILIHANDQYFKLLESLNMPANGLRGKISKDKSFFLDWNDTLNHNYKKEVQFIKDDKSILYFNIFTMPLYVNRKVKYRLDVIYDVTETVLKRKNVERQKDQMKIILDNVSDEVVMLNNEREFIYANKASIKKTGKLYGENRFNNLVEDKDIDTYLGMVGDVKLNTVDGDEIPFEDIPVEKVLRGESFSNYKFLVTSDYSTNYNSVYGTPLYDDNGLQEGGLLIFRDLTNRIMLEEYSVLKDKTRDLLLNYASLSYPDFNIMYVNDEGYKTLKQRNPYIKNVLSLIGEDFFDYYGIDRSEEIDLKKNLSKMIAENKSFYKNIYKIKVNNKSKYLKTIFQPTYNKNKKVEKIKVVGIDITKEKHDNERLKMALKTQDEIFVNISHELKTPLNVISSAAQLLRKQLEKDEFLNVNGDTYYTNEIILQNCYRLTKLINNILDIAKIESGFYKLNLTNNDIVSCTEEIIDSIAKYVKDKGLAIVFDTDTEEMEIAIDRDKFERIMLNLISNAIKFSKEEGIIFVNLYTKDDFIEICVEDEGIGIAENDLEKIFKKYHQANKSLARQTEGTGIGLSLVKSLVELLGGEVSVKSVLGEGTSFKIKLPRRTIEAGNDKHHIEFEKDITEIIKFELSDIY